MAINNLLQIARSAMGAHQQALEVTGQNISNASTEGYTRQRAHLVPQMAVSIFGTIGHGVTVDRIERMRSAHLDVALRSEASSLGRHETMATLFARMESVLGEPSEAGLGAALDALWSSFDDLANEPSSAPVRATVRQSAQQLVGTFRAMDVRLGEIQLQARDQLDQTIAEINQQSARVAQLNAQIVAAEGAGHNVSELRDERDLLLDDLARRIPVRVVPAENGAVGVVAGDALLVDGVLARNLTIVDLGSAGISLVSDGVQRQTRPVGGTAGGLLEILNTTLPGLRQELDALAAAVVGEVNGLHAGGVGADGTIGDFFDGTGLTAQAIGLSNAVAASADAIAAGTTGAPGDGSLALAIAALRETPVASLNARSFNESYTATVARLGTQSLQSSTMQASQETVVVSLENQRASVSGVSTDEEMVNLIVQQQAFSAAARMVSVADEMVQEVLQIL